MSTLKQNRDHSFALLSYVARQFLEISQEDWQALGEDQKRIHARSANRALNAAEAFNARQAESH